MQILQVLWRGNSAYWVSCADPEIHAGFENFTLFLFSAGGKISFSLMETVADALENGIPHCPCDAEFW